MKEIVWPNIVTKKDRFCWHILIKIAGKNYLMPVFHREEHHDHGKMNNTDSEYWLLRDKNLVTLESVRTDPDNKEGKYRPTTEELKAMSDINCPDRFQWIPFANKFANITSWSYEFESYNVLDHYSKYDSDEWSVKKKGFCRMYCNGREVYNFSSYNQEYLMARAKQLTVEWGESGGVDPRDPEACIGNKVWYCSQPGIISSVRVPDGEVVITSDRPDGKGFDLKKPWDDDDWVNDHWAGSKDIRTCMFDKNIYWFRSEGNKGHQPKLPDFPQSKPEITKQ